MQIQTVVVIRQTRETIAGIFRIFQYKIVIFTKKNNYILRLFLSIEYHFPLSDYVPKDIFNNLEK